jgi:hypothetical protein
MAALSHPFSERKRCPWPDGYDLPDSQRLSSALEIPAFRATSSKEISRCASRVGGRVHPDLFRNRDMMATPVITAELYTEPTFPVCPLPGTGVGLLTYRYTAIPRGNSSAKCFLARQPTGNADNGYVVRTMDGQATMGPSRGSEFAGT